MRRWLLLISLACVGCGPARPLATSPAATGNAATHPAASQPAMPPALAEFRRQVEQTPANRLDAPYLYFVAALPDRVSEADYHDFVQQMSSDDPNTRANGICGVGAARQPASADHLLKALRDEADPFNRTMAVWCLRGYKADARVAEALEAFLVEAKDIDYQRCMVANGDVVFVRFPGLIGGAGFEAFKALLAIRGREYMLNGEGWRKFADRFVRNVDPQPCSAIDLSRFRSEPPRFDIEEEARRRIREFQQGR